MLDANTIASMSRDAAKRAARENLEPFILWEGDADSFPPFPFPYIGSYHPAGWRRVRTLFVDSSGFGSEDEPALTIRAFKRELKVGYGYAVIEAGEFQVKVGEFKKVSH